MQPSNLHKKQPTTSVFELSNQYFDFIQNPSEYNEYTVCLLLCLIFVADIMHALIG